MINPQSKSLCLKDSSLTKTEAKTQNSLNNTNDFDYRLKVRHVVDIYIYIYMWQSRLKTRLYIRVAHFDFFTFLGAATGSPYIVFI